MTVTDRYPPEELARRRADRYRWMNRVENIPSTRDFDRAIVSEVRQWLAARGIRSPSDLIDPETKEVLDMDATCLVDGIVKTIVRMKFDINNPVTRGRLWARLGLGMPPAPRPRHDEFEW